MYSSQKLNWDHGNIFRLGSKPKSLHVCRNLLENVANHVPQNKKTRRHFSENRILGRLWARARTLMGPIGPGPEPLWPLGAQARILMDGALWARTLMGPIMNQPYYEPAILWTSHSMNQPYYEPAILWTRHILNQTGDDDSSGAEEFPRASKSHPPRTQGQHIP